MKFNTTTILTKKAGTERSVQSWNKKFTESFKKPSVRGALRRSNIRKQWIVATTGETIPDTDYIYGEGINIRPASEQDTAILLENFDLLTRQAKRQGGVSILGLIADGVSTIALVNMGVTFDAPMMEVE